MADLRQRSTPKALIEDDVRQLGFREYMKKAYRENPPDFSPRKESANKIGVTYFITLMLAQYILGGWSLMPHVYKGDNLWLWRLVITVVFIESFYTWFQCCRKYVNKAERLSQYSDRQERAGWRLCAVCQIYVPPRSHHCKLCKACILRQDHHCFFAAGCIGLHTTAYFTIMCFWLLVSQFLALYWSMLYMSQEFHSILHYLPPVTFWNAAWSGTQSWFDFAVCVNLYLILLNIAACMFYFCMELYAARTNQTFHEGSKGIRKYNMGGVISNYRAVFGSYMWIRWLIPFYSSPASDGYDWKIEKYQN